VPPLSSADIYVNRSNSTQYAMAIKSAKAVNISNGTYLTLKGTLEKLPVTNTTFNTNSIDSVPIGWTVGPFYEMNYQTYTVP
jgi:hypothetical protein